MDDRFDLEALRVATPCHARWSEMKGDGQRRFCESCEKNVYSVAGMTEAQVRELVRRSEVVPCMRISRRSDGTVITGDCPVGVARVRRKLALAFLSCLAFGFTLAGSLTSREKKCYDGETMLDHLREKPVVGPVIDKISPQPHVVMGDMPAFTSGSSPVGP